MNPTLDQLKRWAAFCRTHGAPHFYRAWPGLTLLEYLNFHAQQETLQVVEQAGTVVGLSTAHRVADAVVRQALAAGKPVFAWQPDDPAAANLLLGHYIATAPGVLAELVRRTQARFPNWERLKIFALRRSRGGRKQVRYSVQTVRRLARHHQKEFHAKS